MFFLGETLNKRSSPSVKFVLNNSNIIVQSNVTSVVAVGDKTLDLQSEWYKFKTQQGHYFFYFTIFLCVPTTYDFIMIKENETQISITSATHRENTLI